MKSRVVAGAVVIVILGLFFLKNLSIDPEYTAEIERANAQESALRENAVMTFEVDVPSNTLDGDTVWIYLHNQKGYKMDKIGVSTYGHNVSINELETLAENGNVRYRYGRNGYDYHTAEYLEPDTNDYFWTRQGRETKFENGKVQKDAVGRWRWFPAAGTEIVKTSPIEPEGTFSPRINGIEFRSGQVIEDFYVPAFDDFFGSTAAHLKNNGYGWVEIDPAEQLTMVDGLPKVVNNVGENPNYPNEEKLKEEILAYKSQGLKVMLGPQTCCETLDFRNRSDEWWDAYFSEVEGYLVRMAIVAEETGVDSIHYAVGNDYQGADKDERWRRIFQAIKKNFSGDVGQMVWSFQGYGVVPSAEYITWADELDYFYIAIDHSISLEDSPTDAELEEGAGKMLDGTKVLYDEFDKPVLVRTTYFNVKETWRGATFYNISSVAWMGSEEDVLEGGPYEFGPEDQARTVNAYFRAMSQRPFVIGYVQFGYTHWENPLCPDLSVRGKPAEDLWAKWNRMLSENHSG